MPSASIYHPNVPQTGQYHRSKAVFSPPAGNKFSICPEENWHNSDHFWRENYHCRSPSSLRDVQRSPVERPGIPHWDSGRYTATLALRPPVPRLVFLNECPRHKNNKVMRLTRNTAVFEFGAAIRAVQHLGRVNRVRTQTVHLRRYIKLLVCTGDETVGSAC